MYKHEGSYYSYVDTVMSKQGTMIVYADSAENHIIVPESHKIQELAQPRYGVYETPDGKYLWLAGGIEIENGEPYVYLESINDKNEKIKVSYDDFVNNYKYYESSNDDDIRYYDSWFGSERG